MYKGVFSHTLRTNLLNVYPHLTANRELHFPFRLLKQIILIITKLSMKEMGCLSQC